jgi:hypothetical protein
MNEQAVITCPNCLRQYFTAPALHGTVGLCGVCREYFIISIAESAARTDGATVFDDPVVPRYNFLADGCAMMARNVCEMLRLAKQPVTIDAVKEFVRTIPRFGSGNEDWRGRRCIETLDLAHRLTVDTPNWCRFHELVEYFLHYIPTCRLDSADMLKGAFAGVLGEIELDTPMVEAPRKPGPLERWVARRGW